MENVMKHGPMRTCPELVRTVAMHVSRALVFMQERGFFHGDVKPENLLFESVPDREGNPACYPNVRLIDFGHSQYVRSPFSPPPPPPPFLLSRSSMGM